MSPPTGPASATSDRESSGLERGSAAAPPTLYSAMCDVADPHPASDAHETELTTWNVWRRPIDGEAS